MKLRSGKILQSINSDSQKITQNTSSIKEILTCSLLFGSIGLLTLVCDFKHIFQDFKLENITFSLFPDTRIDFSDYF